MCSLPQVKFPSINIHPPFTFSYLPLPPLFLSGNLHTVCLGGGCLISSLYFALPPFPLPSDSCQSVLCIYESVFMLYVNLVCSLDSRTCEIIWYLSFSDWFISLCVILSRSIHAVTKGKISLFFTAV